MDCVVVVGGDNYDQSYGLYYILHSLNLALRKAEVKKLVLYDCSLEEKDIDNSVIEDFKLFDAISARESLTYNIFSSGEKQSPFGFLKISAPSIVLPVSG